MGEIILYRKGDLVKDPMKSCVMLNWINFTNNYHMHFLTLISRQMTGQSDPDRHTGLWHDTLIINHVTFQKYICCGEGGGPKTTKVNCCRVK